MEWSDTIHHLIHDKLRQDLTDTLSELHGELAEAHSTFKMSTTTLHNFIRGLGFSYRLNKSQRSIFERPDLVNKRAAYLSATHQARFEALCLVFIDETWVFSSMTKKRGWNNNSIPRFAPITMLEECSRGKTAAKSKGNKVIVIGAIIEKGAVSRCTKLHHFLSSRDSVAAICSYAVENICSGFGVAVNSLPPFYCFFNPIEKCWSQIKAHLTKLGKPSDALQTFRSESTSDEELPKKRKRSPSTDKEINRPQLELLKYYLSMIR
ncbi:hypothetical protein ANCCEY_05295 [Ancylostoma ceylanicum]|uniref:Tc1-like transposase DDE domain-containing protein n=1 Tax=Ancylostoma ceylanicum TaxID=53326 RepID=A0A0D6LZS5_9BILA|nr:hypothetical protein ANCCEY_05295 [Ancylostoma ceylanicum]